MSRADHPRWKRCVLVLLCAVLVSPLVYAQSQSSNFHTEADLKALQDQYSLANQLYLPCQLQEPSQVQRFRITCTNTSKIDVKVADCCIPGDHWQVKVKQWDSRPNTAVTTAPGGDRNFGVAARVYTYSSSENVDALIECSYPHGVNVFPAGSEILVEFSGTCNATNLGVTHEFDRTP